MTDFDRDDLDRHISGDLDQPDTDELLEAADDARDAAEVEPQLSERDMADLALLDATPRTVRREFDVQAYDEPPATMGDRETWAQGGSVFIDEEGEHHKVDFRLDSGAGLGSTHLSFALDVDGERYVREYIDVTTLVGDWLSSIAGDWITDRLVPKTGDEA